MNTPAGTRGLEQRPRLLSLRIGELLQDVRRGRVRIPTFQRGLKWKTEHVALLFDSIRRGYPVGTLLFWERGATHAKVGFGPVTMDAPANANAWFIVDGQQRVTALVGALLHADWLPGMPVDDHVLFFNAQNGMFVQPAKRLAQLPAHWVPVPRFADTAALLGWLQTYQAAHPDSALVKDILDVAATIQDFQLQVAVVASEDDRPLREIFKRFNTAGVRMEDAEVFAGLHGGHGALTTLEQLGKDLASLGFGVFEPSWLLDANLAAHGVDITRDGVNTLEDPALAAGLPRVRDAVVATVVFLQQHAQIPHLALLPYKHSFVALVKFFFLHPTPHPTSYARLRRWLWRSMLSGALSGDSRPSTRDVLSLVTADEQASLAALAATPDPAGSARDQNVMALVRAKVDARTAGTRLLLLALVDLRPLNWEDGQALEVAALLKGLEGKQPGRLVPKPKVAPAPRQGAQPFEHTLPDSTANRVLVPLPDLATWGKAHDGKFQSAVLASHALNPEVVAALLGHDHTAALRARADIILHVAQDCFSRMAEWDHQDRPPLDLLTVEDEA